MFIKRATLADVHPVVLDSSRRTAQTLSVFDFEPEKDDGYMYVTARALTSDVPNLNGDMFPDAEMKTAYETFKGCPVYVEHANTDLDRARGVIIDAVYHDDNPDDIWTEILMEMDEQTFPELCSMIRSGDLDTMSMGCSIIGSTCSKCGNYAEDCTQFCEHIRSKNASGAYEVCSGIEFIEESWVANPADPTAYMKAIDKTASKGNDMMVRRVASGADADEFCKRLLELEFNHYKVWDSIYDVLEDDDVLNIADRMGIDDETMHEGVRRFWEQEPLFELDLDERQDRLAMHGGAIDADSVLHTAGR